jgi:hypothetical protein
MDELPVAKRDEKNAEIYRRPSNDSAVVPDRVSPAIEGYFRIPAIWVGKAPDPRTVRVLNPVIHHEIVLEKKLACGIISRVQRDGTFFFDFSGWSLAPVVMRLL